MSGDESHDGSRRLLSSESAWPSTIRLILPMFIASIESRVFPELKRIVKPVYDESSLMRITFQILLNFSNVL